MHLWKLLIILVTLGRLTGCAPDGGSAVAPAGGPHLLQAGESRAFEFEARPGQHLAVRVVLAEVDFSGATMVSRLNDLQLPAYHAFGGDTRYDSVRDRPDLHPPIATSEATYVLPARWLHEGLNVLEVTNAGPGQATISTVSFEPVAAHELPRYQNPIYFDFDVWRQGVVMRPGIDWKLDTMLLGVIPGGGADVMNYSGGDGLAQKMATENARVNWGFARSTFYSIWHLVNNADQWARFINVDGRDDTAGKIHVQFANPPTVPAGTDIALIKPNGYLDVLQEGMDGLAAYSTDYNITCEQWGPRGQGFGRWWGRDWSEQGYDAATWADNYQTEFGRVSEYARELNPASTVFAPHWWLPDIRFLLYDTSLARGFKMRDMTDGMMTHYYSFPFGGYDAEGELVMDDERDRPAVARPELQYPGGTFEPPDWDKSRPYMGTWVQIPEVAIDWNRYRLSRTAGDMTLGDPEVNRWPDGRPFTYEAGFDGDEHSYNNETCVYDRNYSGPAPCQFLYAMFTYSLLPTGASEPDELKITRTPPLTPEAPPTHDIFSEVDQPINLYGQWVQSAAHTHRLRTQDPLYGDLFGYTGFEYATTGDYIWLCGIKERHHRREPYNAWNLVRRTCYAFVTADCVYPAMVNDPDANNLFVKVLLLKQDGREVIGIYAVNYDDAPHRLDLTLPVGWTEPTTVQVFDQTAAEWADADERTLTVRAGELRVTADLSGGAPWCMFIYPPAGRACSVLTAAPTPQPRSPWGGVNVQGPSAMLRWQAGGDQGAAVSASVFEVQVAKEMLFRPQDIVIRQGDLRVTTWATPAVLESGRRYHWRVRAIDAEGHSTRWSRPQSFWCDAADRAASPPGDAPIEQTLVPRPAPQPDLAPFTDANNLAHRGMPFAWPNYWEGPGEAVDGMAQSAWVPDDTQREPRFPAWWAVRFDEAQPLRRIAVLWRPDAVARDFEIQVWDGQDWKTIKTVESNADENRSIELDAPVTTRAVRLWITAPVGRTVELAEVYLR